MIEKLLYIPRGAIAYGINDDWLNIRVVDHSHPCMMQSISPVGVDEFSLQQV
jgi:hypothetical protein